MSECWILQLRAALADAIDLVERASTYADDLKRKADSLKVYLRAEGEK